MNEASAIQRLTEIIRRKHFSLSTEATYCGWVRRYISFLRSSGKAGTSEEKMTAYLTRLAKDGVSASTQNQAFNALRFFYEAALDQKLSDISALRAKRGKRERHAPSRKQVKSILDNAKDVHGYPTRLIVRMLYACGLRVSEPLNLRIKDIDLDNSRLMIREAKRNKDRLISLPCSLVPEIQEQIRIARRFYDLDHERNIPVPLPGLLAKKYKSAPYAWQWYWLFPSAKTCEHPRTGETVRWRVHEANVQKCVRDAARFSGLDGAITPHNLRHSYATHLLARGVDMKSLAEALGHSSIMTTAGYCHAYALSVPSPLELTTP